MAQQMIRGGSPVEIPTADEIGAQMDARLAAFAREQAALESARQRERVRAVKWLRLPGTLAGAVASNAITLGAASGQMLGPAEGYAWMARRLVVSGLASGATPDVVNLYRNDAFASAPLWQFNGNNFGYTFGRGELVFMPGDTLSLKNSGTITATGTITLAGEVLEIPADRLAELLI